ncbi:MAG: hypothetical protein ACXAC2_04210 [Candidatus Kariarchaeaceae archaeon]
MGQNKRKLVMVLTTIFIVQLLLNAIVYYGLWYLQENKDLRFGYRLESTDYHENIRLNNFFVDMNGYTKISTKTGLNENFEVESTSKAERYDLNQNFLWEVDISQISQPQNIAISSEVIIETERFLGHSSDQNITKTLSRTFNVYQFDNITIKKEYVQPLNFSFNSSFESDYHNELQTFGYIVGDYYVNLEYSMLEQYNATSRDWETLSINNSLIFFNIHTLTGSSILLTDPNVSLHSIRQLTQSTVNLYAVKPDDQIVEIFEVNFEVSSLNRIDQIEIPSCSSYDCGYSIIPYHQKLTILILGESEVDPQIDDQVILQASFISTGKEDTWIHQIEEDWVITSIQVIDDTVILGESTFVDSKTNSRLILLRSGNHQMKKINLLDYENQDGGYIFRIFELNQNKIGIVKAQRSSDGYYDIQVLTLNPTDLMGLLFSHWLIPHLIATSALMIAIVIILYRKNIVEPSSEVYPEN